MEEEFLRFLDAGGIGSGDDQLDIGRAFGESAVASEQGDRDHPAPPCLLDRGENIPRFARARNSDEHVAILKNLRNLCAPSGTLAIFEHNPVNPITRKIVHDCPFDEGVTLISPRSLRGRLTAAGWHGLRRSYISFVPPKLKRVKRVERFLTWCPLGGQYFITAHPADSQDVA